MSLHLTHEVLHLGLRDPFRIARSDHADGHRVTTVIVELRDDRFPGVTGVGEGYPDRFYGETPATMAAVFPMLLDAVGSFEPDEAGLIAADLAMEAAIRGHGAARCAIDIALHDLAGKVAGLPVYELRGLSTDLPPTDFTIGIDEPAVVARACRAGGRLPGPQDQVRRARRPRDATGRARGVRRPDPRRREHGLDAGGRRTAAPRDWSPSASS